MRYELLEAAENDKRMVRRATTLHLMIAIALCGMAAGCGLLVWLKALWPESTRALTSIGIFSAVCLVCGAGIATITISRRSWIMNGKRSVWLRLLEVALMAIAATIFTIAGHRTGAIVFGIITAALLLVAIYESRPQPVRTITITEGGIGLLAGRTSKTYRWREVEGLILRHNILSIELSGNRLLQREIAGKDADSSTIEAFARQAIAATARERAENAPW